MVWLRSLISWIAWVFLTLTMGTTVGAVAVFNRRASWGVSRLWARLLLQAAGIKVELRGGQSADPAKVVKGKRMPGRMGNVHVTTQGIEVVQVDPEKNLLAVLGAVPGANGGVVEVAKRTA